MNLLKIRYFLFFFTLISCSINYDKEYLEVMSPIINMKNKEKEKKKIDDEYEPDFPDLKKNQETVLGIDSNNNHIRDDIEIYINRSFKDANHRKALKQYARSWTDLLSLKSSNPNEVQEYLERSDLLLSCVMFISFNTWVDDMNKIINLTINTKLRDEYLRHLQKIVAGRGIGRSNWETPEQECHFKIENFDKLKDNYKKMREK